MNDNLKGNLNEILDNKINHTEYYRKILSDTT